MAKRQYSDDEKKKNLSSYLNAKGGTYHSYLAMLGESFVNRVDLLAQLLNEAHYPTTGQYKERLLANLLKDFVPRQYSVGTGFVLFPIESYEIDGHGDEAEAVLAIENHVTSKQMDIIVYDTHSYPEIFRSEDVVVVRPEAVRCLIEVKGQLDQEDTDDMVSKFGDFAMKWLDCVKCYNACGIELNHKPTMLGMCWAIRPDGEGREKTDGRRLRERIVEYYQSGQFGDVDKSFPLISAVCIYKHHIVAATRELGPDMQVQYGYETLPGTYTLAARKMDRTVAFLLERIQLSLETKLARKAFSVPMPEEWEVELSDDEFLGFSEVGHYKL